MGLAGSGDNRAGTPLDYLKANQETILAELIEFASIPSVSIDLAFEEVVIRTAEWVAGQLRTTGAFEPQIIETSVNPVMYGEWLDAPCAPNYFDLRSLWCSITRSIG